MKRTQHGGLQTWSRWALFLTVLMVASCASEPQPGRIPIPHPDLSASDPAVREQIDERRTALDSLLTQKGTPPAELAEVYGELGLVYIPYDFLAAAEACFDNARQLAPDDYRWSYLSGYLRRVQGELPAAAELFEAALVLEPRLLTARLRLGRTHLDLGDPVAAGEQFQAALEVDGESAAAYEGLGRVASAQGDHQAAAQNFERALELQPDASGVRYALGQEYRNLGDLERARIELAASGDVVTRVPDPLINPLAGLAAGAQFFFVQGGEALDDGDFESAAASFRAAVDRDPSSFRAYLGWAYSLERMGDADGAMAALEQGLENGGGDSPVEAAQQRGDLLGKLGSLLVAAGRDDEAIERWEESVELASEQPAIHLRLADALARQKRFAEAVERYDQVTRLVPDQEAAVLERRATALINLGRGDEAIADFRRALSAAPESVRLRQRFAAALAFLGDEAAAAAMRREAEQVAAGTAGGGVAGQVRSLSENASAAIQQGDYTAAEKALRQALELAPANADARFGLASLLGHVGRYADAVGEFRTVIEAAPRHGPALRGEIIALVLSGQDGLARVRLSEAVRLFPRDAQLALTQVRLLATAPDAAVRDGELALEIAGRVAAERSGERPVQEALALAYAAAGRFDQALALQSELVAADGARVVGGDPAAVLRRERLAAFEAGQGWAARSPNEILVDLGG